MVIEFELNKDLKKRDTLLSVLIFSHPLRNSMVYNCGCHYAVSISFLRGFRMMAMSLTLSMRDNDFCGIKDLITNLIETCTWSYDNKKDYGNQRI